MRDASVALAPISLRIRVASQNRRHPTLAKSCETCYRTGMATMTVRDVRLKWPEAERILARDGEIVVTRDAKPVARILPYRSPRMARRKRFDPKQHGAWLRRFWKTQPAQPRTDDLLRRERDE